MDATVKVRAGGILGFVSFDRVSNVINLATLGIPGYSIHHVGIVSRKDDKLLAYESTTSERPPCAIAGKKIEGVQAHTIEELIALPFYNRIYFYPLRRSMYLHEETRLARYLDSQLGIKYDMKGAMRSGGIVYSLLNTILRGEDVSTLFCSELCMTALVNTGMARTKDASRWSPNKLCRWLVRHGIHNRPVRIK